MASIAEEQLSATSFAKREILFDIALSNRVVRYGHVNDAVGYGEIGGTFSSLSFPKISSARIGAMRQN